MAMELQRSGFLKDRKKIISRIYQLRTKITKQLSLYFKNSKNIVKNYCHLCDQRSFIYR